MSKRRDPSFGSTGLLALLVSLLIVFSCSYSVLGPCPLLVMLFFEIEAWVLNVTTRRGRLSRAAGVHMYDAIIVFEEPCAAESWYG
jgi:hypothetical protein